MRIFDSVDLVNKSETPVMKTQIAGYVREWRYRWLSARLQYPQCANNGDTKVLNLTSDMMWAIEIGVHAQSVW